MNKITYAIAFVILLTVCFMTISCKKEKNNEATINRDCTGTYLRVDSKDYKVCNTEKTENFSQEQIVKVTFNKMDDCNSSGNFASTCFKLRHYEGWVQIIKIK